MERVGGGAEDPRGGTTAPAAHIRRRGKRRRGRAAQEDTRGGWVGQAALEAEDGEEDPSRRSRRDDDGKTLDTDEERCARLLQEAFSDGLIPRGTDATSCTPSDDFGGGGVDRDRAVLAILHGEQPPPYQVPPASRVF